MPMILLGVAVLGVGLLLAALVTRLSVSHVRTGLVAFLVIFGAVILAVLAWSGRFGLALGAGAYLFWLLRLARARPAPTSQQGAPHRASGKMSRRQALEVLGLEVGAQPDAIEAAYKALIVKNHPDQGGTDWLAAQLNEAREVLMADFS
jgi:hypothetical protein